MKITDIEKQLIFILILLSAVGAFYVRSIKAEIKNGETKAQEIAAYEDSIKPFLNLALNAKTFAIYDTENSNFIYKKNAESPMPLASLAKVMSAIVVLENAPSDKVFEISKESLSQVADHGLMLGEKWHRDELLKFALIVSSNDGIHELALETGKIIDPNSTDPVKTFVGRLNSRAAELGFKSFRFANESGLDISPTENGAYANARDMARLFAYAVKTYPQIFGATATKVASISSLDKIHNIDNTNTVVEEIPGIRASKTGFTGLSGGNLVVDTNKDGKETVIIVMGSTYDDRFVDMKMLTGAVSRAAY